MGMGGFAVSTPIAVTITPVAPTVNAGGPYSIAEGQPLTLAGSGSDLGGVPLTFTGHQRRWRVWQCHGGESYTYLDPAKRWESRRDRPTTSRSRETMVRVESVLDSHDTDHGPFTAVPSAGGPYTVSEGQSLTLAGSSTDPGGVPLSYSWDLNDDLVFGDAIGARIQP